ncbi:hypothetical protein AVEN_108301-1 [Araneus ventricosus]|uniref:Uncharacterized protein n=1 Tax=Araneus ventricosus TaxID=182803 RepID=A0A4Y2NM76_ARAVE|nr:hypothetical protein AVEN_108301-1 [Araneus ventricosus]
MFGRGAVTNRYVYMSDVPILWVCVRLGVRKLKIGNAETRKQNRKCGMMRLSANKQMDAPWCPGLVAPGCEVQLVLSLPRSEWPSFLFCAG